MFATMRRKSRNRRLKNELGQSVDHFKRAATLAAQETSATVGPTFTAAVDRVQPAATKAKDVASSGWGSAVATLTPLVAAATDKVQQSGKVSKKVAKKTAKKNQKNAEKLQKRANSALGRKQGSRKTQLLGFALIGTAVGVGAAYLNKRRKAAQWDEYDPAAPINSGADDAAFEPADFAATETVVVTEPVISPNGTVPDTASKTPR
ncbi:MAG: hypothetical protein ABW046_11935 [Actinoplanes sp.]